MRKNRKRSRYKVLNSVAKNATIENKLTQQALLLSYEFEYGVDFQRRIIKITDEIDELTFDVIDGALTELESHGKADITIKICSPGGSTYHAMAIVDRLKESSCKIVTKGYGAVMSAATLILASGTRRREMASGGFFMWHEASYGTNGRHSENKALVRQVEREEKLWAKRMAEVTGKTEKFWLENGVGIDAYFNAEQLLKHGVVDELF